MDHWNLEAFKAQQKASRERAEAAARESLDRATRITATSEARAASIKQMADAVRRGR